MVRAGANFLLLFGLYLLFAGQASLDEVLAAGLSSAVIAALAGVVSRIAERRFNFSGLPWVRLIFRPLWSVMPDVSRVGMRLAQTRVRGGAIQRWRFMAVGADSERDAARSAALSLAASFAPNGYIIAVLHGRGEVLVHQLVPTEQPGNAQWPL